MHGHTAAVDNKTLRKQIAESGLFTFECVSGNLPKIQEN